MLKDINGKNFFTSDLAASYYILYIMYARVRNYSTAIFSAYPLAALWQYGSEVYPTSAVAVWSIYNGTVAMQPIYNGTVAMPKGIYIFCGTVAELFFYG